MQSELRDLNTAIPGHIESYDAETRTASISIPIVNYTEGEQPSDEVEEDWPVLLGVPVWFPGGGSFHMSWPLANGDPVLIVFCQRDISEWFVSDGKEPHAPEFPELHTENAAICIPRLYPEKAEKKDASDTDVTLQFKTTKFILKPNGDVVIEGPKLIVGSDSGSTPLANGNVTQSQISANNERINTLSAILGLPPVVLTGNIKSSKAFTND